MNRDEWQQVKEIFDAALKLAPAERICFLDETCSDNNSLRGEVEKLLTSFKDDSFLEQPAAKQFASLIVEEDNLERGRTIGHYEIIRQIGAGGMGKVYLANDKKLNRRVALKVLHQNLAADNQAGRRLVREAQAAALLDHPHICQIHEIAETDDGSFIVMQYVEGETLADVLAKRPGVEKSLDLAIQITDALAEAHLHRIIHRDIKPANIIVNEKWQAKVLDFGLAKFLEVESDGETAKRLSNSGAVMGTVPYMSPEQLRGLRLDTRTDIFSFGAMFYEMLSGRQAFTGESSAETISAILNDQPDWTLIPHRLQPIVQKSLMKNKDDRYQAANDLTRDLKDARQSGDLLLGTNGKFTLPPQTETVSGWSFRRIFSRKTARFFRKSRGFHFLKSSTPGIEPETESFGGEQMAKAKTVRLNHFAVLTASTIFLLIGAAVWWAWQFQKTGGSHSFDALRSVRLVWWKTGAAGSVYTDYRVSHDGKMIAYSSTQNGENEEIYVKQTADGKDIRVTKGEWTNFSPLWSPDDQRIAFASVREGKSGIYVCPLLGGAALPLKIIGEGNVSLRHWSKDGAAIFYELGGNLFRLDLAMRETAQITDFPASPSAERYFSLSPNEDR
ncbi:MAG: protein kinase, partial [Acidobacteriota bacterium]